MVIILIRGPLGVGKTSVAKLLCKQIDGCYISIDAVLDEHGLDQGKNGIPAGNFIKANELALPKARQALAAGKAVIFDGNFYYKSPIWHLRRSLPPPQILFNLQASLETCIERDRGRELVYGVDSASWVYYLVSRFDMGIPIATDGKSAGQVVQELLKAMREKYPV
jgi:adenylate kinase family enzyme